HFLPIVTSSDWFRNMWRSLNSRRPCFMRIFFIAILQIYTKICKKPARRRMMKFKRNKVEDVHINLTPMIDCLLFILVFLLLSTTFSQMSRMNLTLPDAQGVPPKSYDQKVEVIVDANGHYAVNGQSLASKEVADLNTAIKQ